jgi:8-oxo-dGTP pyrophosphatase MutT (NUDIX family)
MTSVSADEEKYAFRSAWLSHGERIVYDNYWVRLSMVDVELPDGQRFEHHVVTMPAAAMAVLLDESEERVLLLWRHRFASGIWNWELPGGVVELDEDPVGAVLREVEEETGYRPGETRHLLTFEPMIGSLRCPHHVYLAREPKLIGEPTETTEMQRMEWVPLMNVPGLIAGGQIRNSGTLVGLLHVLATRGGLLPQPPPAKPGSAAPPRRPAGPPRKPPVA